MRRKGILFKTFLFTSGLISLIIAVSFGILYLTLPKYYLNKKNETLRKNTQALSEDINKTKEEDKIKGLISQFCLDNNADIMSYDAEGKLDLRYSSPFVSYNIQGSILDSMHQFIFATDDEGKLMDQIEIPLEVPGVLEYKGTIAVEQFRVVTGTGYNGVEQDTLKLTKELASEILSKIQIIGRLQPIDEANKVIISLIPYLLFIDLMIALCAAYFFARKITRPIIRLSETAAEMQQLNANISSNIRTEDEIGELSQNLDYLYANLCANIDQLQEEMNKVKSLEQSKTDFMRAASHELKTPIAALNGIMEGMLDNVGKFKDRDKYLTECQVILNRLTQLVKEIMQASRIDVDKTQLKKEEVHIGSLIKEVLRPCRIFIEEKGLEVHINLPDYYLITDMDMFRTVLSNIISNAVKYTEDHGLIRIVIEEQGESHYLIIENQCEEIKEEELEKLSHAFYTRSYSRSRHQSGTGLGLYIVKKYLHKLELEYKFEKSLLGLRVSIQLD